jgi:hypothetical protein
MKHLSKANSLGRLKRRESLGSRDELLREWVSGDAAEISRWPKSLLATRSTTDAVQRQRGLPPPRAAVPAGVKSLVESLS